MNRGIVLALLAMTVSGCSSDYGAYKTGTAVSQAQQQQFKVGSTLQEDVIAALGVPQQQGTVGGLTYYQYNYQEIRALQVLMRGDRNETVVFLFDARGVLKEIQSGQGQATNPLLQAAGIR